jgi:hypothetical protein
LIFFKDSKSKNKRQKDTSIENRALVENQVLGHYALPLKSNFIGMGLMSFHHSLIIVKGNMTIP